MKRNLYVKSLLIALALCVSTFVSAAPRINGIWTGNASKVTTSSCNVRVPIVLTINQCGVSGNLFNGTVKVGSTTIKIVGKINFDNSFRVTGAAGTNTVTMIGQYTPSRLQINELLFATTATTNILNETYDTITLSQLKR
ncbi:hypothetical protein [Crenothrix polyspora]|uniref:Uncharacterized protein n=1 Tax=Crenothrix polyspora TaxID=360316 RepID=A0A1R4HDI8_9GAMM|nr:hypothetical protein [Crenothrix polyspora]SJM94274.1 exported hypothetical protein [Crenothrix polyspora]